MNAYMCSHSFTFVLLYKDDGNIMQSSNCTTISFVTHTIIRVLIQGHTYNYMSRYYNYTIVRF